jgi:hypothetical protein
MKATKDSKTGVGYVYLVDFIKPGGVDESLPIGSFVLDCDSDGVLLGIEFLDLKEMPKELLDKAEEIGDANGGEENTDSKVSS